MGEHPASSLRFILGVVTALHPIHHIERVTIENGSDNGLLSFVVINKLALVGRANIELAAIAAHALLIVVNVALCNLAYGYFYLFFVIIMVRI